MTQTLLDQRVLGLGTDLADHTIVAGDIISFADSGASNVIKRDTVQGVLDLAVGGIFENLFVADNTGDQAIPTGSATKITFNTETLDQGSDFDISNDKFIAPETGKYLFYCQFSYIEASGTGTDQRLILYHYNSSDVEQGSHSFDKTTVHEPALNGMHVVTMSATDYVVMKVYHTAGSDKNLNTCQFFGWKVA